MAKEDVGTRAVKRDKGIVPLTSGDSMFGPEGFAQRIQATVYGAVGSLPRALRTWASVICHAANLGRLTEAMIHWIRGGHLDREQFARLFLGRDADDPLVDLFCSVAPGVARATGHAELGDAAAKIAAAIQMIGPDRWPRFLAELEKRALDPAIVAAVEEQRADPPGDHAIYPDRSPETAPGGSLDATADAANGGDRQQADSEADRTTDPVGHQGAARQAAGGRGGGGEHPRPWGGRSPGPMPPVRNPARLKPGAGSRPSASGASLWDEHGGEWRYHPDDAFHHAHWDYNDHAASDTPWRSIPVENPSPWKR